MIASRSCRHRYLRRRQRENTEHRERDDATPTSDDRDNFLSPTPAPTNAVMAEDDFEQVSARAIFHDFQFLVIFSNYPLESCLILRAILTNLAPWNFKLASDFLIYHEASALPV